MAKRSQLEIKPGLPEEVSAPELAELLGCSERQVRQWATEGVIEKASRGKYVLAPSVQAVVRKALENGSSDMERQRIDFMKAKREALELETAQKKRELLPVADVDAFFQTVFGELKSELLSVPARASRDMTVRREVEKAVVAALNRTAAKINDKATAMQATLALTEGDDND
ncbi:hypothetical protein ASE36_18970 [Rhizobium sp. Root274]|nr:hypothetical protein ASC71_20105 [Rhizobium sp. Root1240]KRD27902.1 hypothetical protein ASE36_18970 [Rhizobium sp. Root274]